MTDNRTTETATDRLRVLLDERGVEHYDGTESTLWLKDEHGYRASADELSSGRLSVHIWCDTPEQAIAATLGNTRSERTCHPYRDKKTQTIRCSICGGSGLNIPRHGQYAFRNYCPNCGAKVVDA